jgi:hypothetical protein
MKFLVDAQLPVRLARFLQSEGYDTFNFDNPPVSAKANAMFDYPEVLDYRSGNVMELESLPTFRQRWNDNGGLRGFQSCIQNLLDLSSDA